MLPAQRWQVGQERIIHGLTVGTQGLHGTLLVDRVPQHDSGREQIQAAGPKALLLEAPVAGFAQSVEKPSSGQGIPSFSFVEPHLHAVAQINVLELAQAERVPLDATQLARGHGQPVLAWVTTEFARRD